MQAGVILAGQGAIGRADERLEARSQRLDRSARFTYTRACSQIDSKEARIDALSHYALRRVEHHVDLIGAKIRALDPKLALARGWSITRNESGVIVRTVNDLAPGSKITTHVADGTATSTIDGIEANSAKPQEQP